MLSRCSFVSEPVRDAPNCGSQGATGAIAQVALAALRMLRRSKVVWVLGLFDVDFTLTSRLQDSFDYQLRFAACTLKRLR